MAAHDGKRQKPVRKGERMKLKTFEWVICLEPLRIYMVSSWEGENIYWRRYRTPNGEVDNLARNEIRMDRGLILKKEVEKGGKPSFPQTSKTNCISLSESRLMSLAFFYDGIAGEYKVAWEISRHRFWSRDYPRRLHVCKIVLICHLNKEFLSHLMKATYFCSIQK